MVHHSTDCIIHTSLMPLTSFASLNGQSSPSSPFIPTTHARKGKGKGRGKGKGKAPAASKARLAWAEHSPALAEPSTAHKGKKIRVELLESESENNQLFAPDVADEGETPQAGISTGGKQDHPDDLLHVEIEEVLPPHKKGKMAHVAFSEVRIIIHICHGLPGLIASTGSLRPLH